MAEINLNAKERIISKKSANKRSRKEGRIPGIFYYKNQEPIPIEISEAALKPIVFTSETNIISLQIENHNDQACILKNIQFDPVTDRIIHVDLQGISRTEKIEIEVPVTITGNAAGIKQGGILQQSLHRITIKCLPSDIPQHLEIDVTNINLGEAIHVSDIHYPNMDIVNSKDAVVVSVVTPRAEKEAVPAVEGAEEAAEPEVIAKGKVEKEE